jgi:hypothetical protein
MARKDKLNTVLECVIEMFANEKRNKISEMDLTDEYKRDMNASVCCTDEEKHDIIANMKIIKNIPEFSSLRDPDICLVLVYTYYSLHYNEQTIDTFDIKYLERHLYNKILGVKLYLVLTTGDLMVEGNNFSSTLRKKLFNMAGNKKSRKYKRTMRNKRNKRNKGRKTRRGE